MTPHSISVLITTYNRAKTICNVLDSVVCQSLPACEIVLIDDGSSDDTAARIESYRKTTSIPIKYIKQNNTGKCGALNNGIKHCKGNYIAFNDSDDTWLPQKLETQIQALVRFPSAKACFTDAVYSNNAALGSSLLATRDDLPSNPISIWTDSHIRLASNPYGIFMQSIVLERELAERVFPLNLAYRVAQDIDLIFRIALETNYACIRETLVLIDRSKETGTRLTGEHDMKSLYRLKLLEQITLNWLEIKNERLDQCRRVLENRLAQYRQSVAYSLLQSKKQGEADQYAKSALTIRIGIKPVCRYIKYLAYRYFSGSSPNRVESG